jgi:hypothetical protein
MAPVGNPAPSAVPAVAHFDFQLRRSAVAMTTDGSYFPAHRSEHLQALFSFSKGWVTC